MPKSWMWDVALESLPLFRPDQEHEQHMALIPWHLDLAGQLIGLWVFGSFYSATFFIVCLYLSKQKIKLSRSSTVERIHSATFSTSCKRFAPFCQIDLNNFVPLHFPTCCVFFCNHLAARLNLISSATFSICCNLCLQISIGNIPFLEMIHSATFSIYCIHFASFCQIDLKNFVPLLFPTCCVFFVIFLPHV